ncbi:MAG: flagellar basal body P-ring formation chaperone FlgA [Planctomycetaceae bacterium]|nr:flagellar basal body P-ring formation chaperone FlgA [Planctomycetaceae bacterium]
MAMRGKLVIPLLLLILLAPTARAEVVVIIRREAQSSGRYIRVCDIARVDGDGDAAREVAMTILGPAPARGETHEFSRWDVESRLYEMGLETDITFTGNDVVRVFGDGASSPQYYAGSPQQELLPLPRQSGLPAAAAVTAPGARSPELRVRPAQGVNEPREQSQSSLRRDLLAPEARTRVGLAISSYIADQYREAKRPDIEIESKVLAADNDIPYSAYEVRVAEAVEARIPGKALMRLVVKDTAQSEPRTVTVSADTQVYGLSLVAARTVMKGEVLDKRDVAVTRVKMESGKMYLPPNRAKAIGLEVQKSFRPGEVILAQDAVMGAAVKRGHMVIVKNEGKGWEILSKGKALGEGSIDDIITVEDSSNRTKFYARITGPNTVAVVLKKDPKK